MKWADDDGLTILDPRADSLARPGEALTRLATGAAWSEGPVWLHEDGSVLWSDIPNDRMLRWHADQGLTVWRERIDFVNGHTHEADGSLLHMAMPPYHGATLRVSEDRIYEFYARLSDALMIPIMIQDAPVSGTVLSTALLARMARELDQIAYFKIETAGAASKLRELIRLGGDAVEGPWDGEEGITLLPDLDAGATGTMTGGAYPDGIRLIVDTYFGGTREEAVAHYQRWLPLINYENRQGGLLAAKALMKEGRVIDCEAPRHPLPELHPETRRGLIETARRLDPLVLRWGR